MSGIGEVEQTPGAALALTTVCVLKNNTGIAQRRQRERESERERERGGAKPTNSLVSSDQLRYFKGKEVTKRKL